ncbi:hypothetical protein [Nioella nitratireducens]|uniref:hypothetical protein n=1 Tax=Nioella nitratireducens TaxID=1287720 RepID=UPI0008FCEB6F|nr:hypothetical protein [Nioella nitratireducens]
MIVKIVTFFLIGMAVMAMFGRLRWPGGAARRKPRNLRGRSSGSLPKPRTCPKCGHISVTGDNCPTCTKRSR